MSRQAFRSRARRLAPAALGLALVAVADAAPADLSDRLRACASETEDSRRLSCYDEIAKALPRSGSKSNAALAAPPVGATGSAPPALVTSAVTAAPVTPPAPAATTAPAAPASITSQNAAASQFGVSNGPLQAKQSQHKPKLMTASVESVSSRALGQLVVTLDNGQVWVQNEALSYFPLKPGDRVEINVGAMGSYTMWVPSTRRASRVTRIN
jgi:hypothetical protein